MLSDTDFLLSLASMYVLGLVSAPTFQRPARKRGRRLVMRRYAIDVDDYRAVMLEWRKRASSRCCSLAFATSADCCWRRPTPSPSNTVRCMPKRVRSCRFPGCPREDWLGAAVVARERSVVALSWDLQHCCVMVEREGIGAARSSLGVSGFCCASSRTTSRLNGGAALPSFCHSARRKFPLAMKHLDYVADCINALVEQRHQERDQLVVLHHRPQRAGQHSAASHGPSQ